jgi:HEAT repeat protein
MRYNEKSMESIEDLIRDLFDPNEMVRKGAAEALGEIGDTRAVEPLRKLLSDPRRSVREAAEKAIKKFRGDKRFCAPHRRLGRKARGCWHLGRR